MGKDNKSLETNLKKYCSGKCIFALILTILIIFSFVNKITCSLNFLLILFYQNIYKIKTLLVRQFICCGGGLYFSSPLLTYFLRFSSSCSCPCVFCSHIYVSHVITTAIFLSGSRLNNNQLTISRVFVLYPSLPSSLHSLLFLFCSFCKYIIIIMQNEICLLYIMGIITVSRTISNA